MQIRKATAKDYKDMLIIWEECISKTCQFLTTNEINKEVETLEEKYFTDPNVKSFVQIIDGEMVGFSSIRDNELLFTPLNPRLFGKGISESIVGYLFDKHAIDTAYVYSNDMDTLAFYTSLGFAIEDRIEDIFFNNGYQLNRLKLTMSPKEAAQRIAAKKKSS
ncbi:MULTISPECIES: GNAT family N-acetyltransferase [unclassified Francisella]|uniref:GNAT family N-acetyltransferase n=1 Tax=unclassified Francisella TaxID=2610885 RepID=UPI002E3005F7|nr:MULTISPECIES: GNAT family N-acetyltransferase [unclassified Francisella]MED7818361.1 GNAT family N-acetyltransferase [Francisella sp. 19S2-4]MED7829197.1 GNAT family N-acetyltransferase [Francisella sp. 19S2-10]